MMSGQLSNTFRQSKGGQSRKDSKKVSTRTGGSQETSSGPPDRRDATDEIDEQTARLLLTFDLTNKFGPCTGITRLERWERANKLGLHPPAEVKSTIEDAPDGLQELLNKGIWEGRGI